MKTKFICLILCIFTAFSLAGCGLDASSAGSGSETYESTVSSVDEEEAEEDAFLDEDDAQGDYDNDFLNEVTIDETVIYSENDITVTALEIYMGGSAQKIRLQIENASDTDISLYAEYLYVNDICLGQSFDISEEAEAGCETTGLLWLEYEDLKRCGIDTAAVITFDLVICDDSDDEIARESIELVTSAGEDYVQEINSSGTVFYEYYNIKVVFLGVYDDVKDCDYAFRFYIKNDFGTTLSISEYQLSVNGSDEISGSLEGAVRTGTATIVDLKIWDAEEIGIESIDDITKMTCGMFFTYEETDDYYLPLWSGLHTVTP